MLELVRSSLASLREAVAIIQERPMNGAHAAELVSLLNEVERVAAAGRTIAAHRVAESKLWQREGHRTPAHWVAAKTGSTVGQAVSVLETAKRLEDQPLTRAAFCSGKLSETQTRDVADAAAADPRAERLLIDTAQSSSVMTLRDACRRVVAAAVPDEIANNERIRRGRYFRHWTESDGSVRLAARLTPADGATVIAVADVERARLFSEARRAGLRESSEAYADDALVAMARKASDVCFRSSENRSSPRAMVHVLVDHKVLRTGRASGEQTCEIPGIGRIPAATARSLAGDAIVKAVVTKGSDIQSVVHVGRTIPARVRTALEVRDPTCVVPGCDARRELEIDHWRVAFADGGPSTLENLARVCSWHHYQKTHLGYRLRGGPGAWTWETPDQIEGSGMPPPAS